MRHRDIESIRPSSTCNPDIDRMDTFTGDLQLSVWFQVMRATLSTYQNKKEILMPNRFSLFTASFELLLYQCIGF